MTWGRDEPSYRYCHAMSEEEEEELHRLLPLKLVSSFEADGELNRYWVLRRP